jgi:hypothetical protein
MLPNRRGQWSDVQLEFKHASLASDDTANTTPYFPLYWRGNAYDECESPFDRLITSFQRSNANR